jgi:hypothetical protein
MPGIDAIEAVPEAAAAGVTPALASLRPLVTTSQSASDTSIATPVAAIARATARRPTAGGTSLGLSGVLMAILSVNVFTEYRLLHR